MHKKLPVIIAGLAGLATVVYLYYQCRFTVDYYHFSVTGVETTLPNSWRYDSSKMWPLQSLELFSLVHKSGILLPQNRVKFAFVEGEAEENQQTQAKIIATRPHGGYGRYGISAYSQPGGILPQVNVEWTAERAPETVWPLVKFLEATVPTELFPIVNAGD